MKNLRPLTSKECRLLIVRHEKHTNQVLPPDAEERLNQKGATLAAAGMKLDVVYSSPQPRALATALHIMKGAGQMVECRTREALDAFSSQHPELMDELKAKAAAQKKSPEATLLADPSYRSLVVQRAISSSAAIVENIIEPGKTILVAGHGGSLEPMIAAMLSDSFDPTTITDLLATGEIVEIIIDGPDRPIEVNYLDRE